MTSNQVLLDHIIERSQQDPQFLAELLHCPKKAVESALGITIPERVIIKVVQERQHQYTIVLPPIGGQPTASTDPGLEATSWH